MNTFSKKLSLIVLLAVAGQVMAMSENNPGSRRERLRAKRGMAASSTEKRLKCTSDVAMVANNASLTQRIFELAHTIATTRGENVHVARKENRAELKDLMNQLNPKIKKLVDKQVNTVLTSKSNKAIDEADMRLQDVKDQVIAEANVIEAYARGAKRVEDAPVAMKPQVTAESTADIQAAEDQAEETYLGRAKIFIKQYATLKNAFVAAVGAAALGTAYIAGPEAYKAGKEAYMKLTPEGGMWTGTKAVSGAALGAGYGALGTAAKTGYNRAGTAYESIKAAPGAFGTWAGAKYRSWRGLDAQLEQQQKLETLADLKQAEADEARAKADALLAASNPIID